VLIGGSTVFGTPNLPLQEISELATGSDGYEMEVGNSPSTDHFGTGFPRGNQDNGFTEDSEEPSKKTERKDFFRKTFRSGNGKIL